LFPRVFLADIKVSQEKSIRINFGGPKLSYRTSFKLDKLKNNLHKHSPRSAKNPTGIFQLGDISGRLLRVCGCKSHEHLSENRKSAPRRAIPGFNSARIAH
jgi:hypothetical protein